MKTTVQVKGRWDARRAAAFVYAASGVDAAVRLSAEGVTADGKSLMQVAALGLEPDVDVLLEVKGKDEALGTTILVVELEDGAVPEQEDINSFVGLLQELRPTTSKELAKAWKRVRAKLLPEPPKRGPRGQKKRRGSSAGARTVTEPGVPTGHAGYIKALDDVLRHAWAVRKALTTAGHVRRVETRDLDRMDELLDRLSAYIRMAERMNRRQRQLLEPGTGPWALQEVAQEMSRALRKNHDAIQAYLAEKAGGRTELLRCLWDDVRLRAMSGVCRGEFNLLTGNVDDWLMSIAGSVRSDFERVIECQRGETGFKTVDLATVARDLQEGLYRGRARLLAGAGGDKLAALLQFAGDRRALSGGDWADVVLERALQDSDHKEP